MGVAKWATEDAQQHQRAQALAVDLGQVAGQRVDVLRVAKVGALTIAHYRVC